MIETVELVKRKKGNRFSKIIVALSLMIPFLYTCVSIYFAWYEKYLPSELTIGVFGFFGTELLAVAWRTKDNNGGVDECQLQG